MIGLKVANLKLEVIIFYLIRFLYKKNNQIKILKKNKNRNRFKPTGFGSVLFFRTKTGLNRFGSVFLGLARFWLGFFCVGLVFFFGSVQFGFFGFLLIKPKPNRTDRFFQNFNWFFYGSVFLVFFVQFSRFNWFFSFFAHHYLKPFSQFNISKF
jgi:hypothetical protein